MNCFQLTILQNYSFKSCTYYKNFLVLTVFQYKNPIEPTNSHSNEHGSSRTQGLGDKTISVFWKLVTSYIKLSVFFHLFVSVVYSFVQTFIISTSSFRKSLSNFKGLPYVSLPDQDSSMVDALGQTKLEHLRLKTPLQEIFDPKTQHVIELHSALI